jgi:hypothetical protein
MYGMIFIRGTGNVHAVADLRFYNNDVRSLCGQQKMGRRNCPLCLTYYFGGRYPAIAAAGTVAGSL